MGRGIERMIVGARGLVLRGGRALGPLAGLAILVAFLDVNDWGHGVARGLGLLFAAWLAALAWARPLPPVRRAGGWVAPAVLACTLQLAMAAPRLVAADNRPNDIGATTIAAVAALGQRQSPYRARIDDQYAPGRGFHDFSGYKYGPLVPRYYAPFLRWAGRPRGLYAGNLVLLGAAAALAAWLGRRAAGSATAAVVAVVALLSPGFVGFELFVQGVNDLLPTVLALAALALDLGGWGLGAGVALGLSLACKPLPGALYLALLAWHKAPLRRALGVVAGAAVALPDLVAAPRELVANLVLFNLRRPSDSTSLVHALPGPAQLAAALVGLLAIALVVVAYQRGARAVDDPRRAARRLVCAAAIVVALFLASGKLIHRNYLLWWLPLAAAACAGAGYRRDDTSTATATATPATATPGAQP